MEFSVEKNPPFSFFAAHLIAKSAYHISVKGPHCLCVLTDKMHKKVYEPAPVPFFNLKLDCHDEVTHPKQKRSSTPYHYKNKYIAH